MKTPQVASGALLRVNATVDKATPLVEEWGKLRGELTVIERNRDSAIAATNAVADTLAAPVLAKLQMIEEALGPWWLRGGRAMLIKGTRKSIELLGCVLGSRTAKGKLSFANGDDEAAIAALRAHRWAKPMVRTTVSLDKVAIAAELDGGKRAAELKAIGFSIEGGGEAFYIKPVTQEGTQAKAAA